MSEQLRSLSMEARSSDRNSAKNPTQAKALPFDVSSSEVAIDNGTRI
jgi:hypothetical protein